MRTLTASRAGVFAIAISAALTACDLNPRPEDPGGNASIAVPPGNFGTGGSGTAGAPGAPTGAAGAPPFDSNGGGSSGAPVIAPPPAPTQDAGTLRDAGAPGDGGPPEDAGVDAAPQK